MIVMIIGVCNKTRMTNCLYDQQSWPVYFTISNIQNMVCSTTKNCTTVLIWQLSSPRKGAQIIETSMYKQVEIMLLPVSNFDKVGSEFKHKNATPFCWSC